MYNQLGPTVWRKRKLKGLLGKWFFVKCEMLFIIKSQAYVLRKETNRPTMSNLFLQNAKVTDARIDIAH